MFIKMQKLSPADSCRDIAHPIVIADFGMLVMSRFIACLRRKKTCAPDFLFIVRNKHTAARRCDDLIAVKRIDPEPSECSGLPPLIARAE